MSFGCGSITDGEFKLTVQIANFVSCDIEKGTFVTITGEVQNKGAYIHLFLWVAQLKIDIINIIILKYYHYSFSF